jgi:hypothetical protein
VFLVVLRVLPAMRGSRLQGNPALTRRQSDCPMAAAGLKCGVRIAIVLSLAARLG